MIPLPLHEVAAATDGRLRAAAADDVVRSTVVVDSRLVEAESLFVCVPGERVDGHDFARAAVDAGAVAALAQRDVDAPAVVVADTTSALGQLARVVLSSLSGCHVVGITGSSGKTSTKDLLAQVYERRGPTVAPVGSFNNEVGFPLTVWGCHPATRTRVGDNGARGPGHIANLCAFPNPATALAPKGGAANPAASGSRTPVASAQ